MIRRYKLRARRRVGIEADMQPDVCQKGYVSVISESSWFAPSPLLPRRSPGKLNHGDPPSISPLTYKLRSSDCLDFQGSFPPLLPLLGGRQFPLATGGLDTTTMLRGSNDGFVA